VELKKGERVGEISKKNTKTGVPHFLLTKN